MSAQEILAGRIEAALRRAFPYIDIRGYEDSDDEEWQTIALVAAEAAAGRDIETLEPNGWGKPWVTHAT